VIPSSMDTNNQTRSDARTSYLDPIILRSNLHLLTDYTVTRILHNNDTTNNPTPSPETDGVWITGVEVSYLVQKEALAGL
jgi:choline dehydrogenase